MNFEETKTSFEKKHTNEELYYRQVELLKTFLERNAISQTQYDKSFYDLTEKMGMGTSDEQGKTQRN